MEKIEVILTGCISEIKAGRAGVEECLGRYPSLRQELEPLLKLALNIQEPENLKLDSSYKQAVKSRLLQQIGAAKPKQPRSFTDIFSFGIPARFAWARIAVSVLAVVIILSMAAGGTAYASQDSLPGDLLYPVKTTTEDFRLIFAGNNAQKTELSLQFARRRLNEMDRLVSGDESNAALAVEGYRNNLGSAQEHILSISDTATLSKVLESSLAEIKDQMVYCDNIIDTDPAYLTPAEEANSLTIATQLELMRLLQEQDIVRAAQANLDIMQNRLQRAQAQAGEGRFRVMQEVLLQYQQLSGLGEEILQLARTENNNPAEIEALSLDALNGYLDTLESIAGEAPQEYQNTIETCRQSTIRFQAQAGQQHQHRGGDDGSSGQQTPGNTGISGDGQSGQTAPENPDTDGSSGAITPAGTPSPFGPGEDGSGGSGNPGITVPGSGGDGPSGNSTWGGGSNGKRNGR